MDARAFRNAMGAFPTGVTVVTTAIGDAVHGMTANALMSVSLNPKLLLISVGKQANMLDKISRSNQFALSILTVNQHDIAMHFAGQKKRDLDIHFDWLNGLPVIPNSLVQIACTVGESYVAGDHTLFLGKVEDLRQENEGSPLIFYKGKYQALGE